MSDVMPLSVLCTRGDGVFLISVGDGLGVILNTSSRPPVLFLPPKSVASHMARGSWTDCEGDIEDVLELAKRAVKVVDSRAPIDLS